MAAWRWIFNKYTPISSVNEAPGVVRITLPQETGTNISYAKELRVVGQALEKFKFTAFKLERREGIYTIRGTASADLAATFSIIQFVRDIVRGARSSRQANQPIELSYSLPEIENLDAQERAKRAHSDKLPDPYSISQILRGVGAFLDHRQAVSLATIGYQDRWVTVVYSSVDGHTEQEKQDLDYFYDYSVKMYLRRSNRVNVAAPSEPTLYVDWEQSRKEYKLSKVPL
jgi:hypothetical protein